jgi:hypothetical protein
MQAVERAEQINAGTTFSWDFLGMADNYFTCASGGRKEPK